MFTTLKSIFVGRAARASRTMETQNAALIIEGKIAQAETAQESAKRALAGLISRTRMEEQALSALTRRMNDLEGRISEALSAGNDSLAADAADMLASLENEQTVRQATLQTSGDKAERLRLVIEKSHRRLIDLKQGLISARAIEAERASAQSLNGDVSAGSAIREGEAVLARLMASESPLDHMEALDEIDAQLSGETTLDRMAEAGFGAPIKVRGADVLARLKAKHTTKPSKA